MIRNIEYKLYPNAAQRKTLNRWLSACCWVYNHALAQRTKAYKRRGESVNYYDQQLQLTKQRARVEFLQQVPLRFERDALCRVDRGMKAFFRRLKANEKPGYPRFKSRQRYNSMEYMEKGTYLKGRRIRVPTMGTIRCRGRSLPEGTQKGLRIIRRSTGWFAQIVLDDGCEVPAKVSVESAIGVDVGLSSFATLSNGEKIANHRWLSKSARKLRALQRRVSRCKKWSHRRKKAVNAFSRRYCVLAAQRNSFCHQHSTALVRKYDLIAVEKLNVTGMTRSRFGKSILDASWSRFTEQLSVKAEWAGRQVVFVNARGTSQECPDCGATKPKHISERTHSCVCGLVCDRDHAAARVILARALAGKRGESRVEGGSAGQQHVPLVKLRPLNRVYVEAHSDGPDA